MDVPRAVAISVPAVVGAAFGFNFTANMSTFPFPPADLDGSCDTRNGTPRGLPELALDVPRRLRLVEVDITKMGALISRDFLSQSPPWRRMDYKTFAS